MFFLSRLILCHIMSCHIVANVNSRSGPAQPPPNSSNRVAVGRACGNPTGSCDTNLKRPPLVRPPPSVAGSTVDFASPSENCSASERHSVLFIDKKTDLAHDFAGSWRRPQSIRTAPMLNQPVKGVWPICQVDVQIGKEGNAAPVGLYMHPQINSEQGGSSQWRGVAHMTAGCSGDNVPSGRR